MVEHEHEHEHERGEALNTVPASGWVVALRGWRRGRLRASAFSFRMGGWPSSLEPQASSAGWVGGSSIQHPASCIKQRVGGCGRYMTQVKDRYATEAHHPR